MGDIGFAHLPNQIHRQATEKGFEFNLMVVGESGLGKSTFINTLFATDLYVDQEYGEPGARIPSTTEIKTCSVLLEEKGVQLRLNLIDTPGFGNNVDNTNCWEPIEEYITRQFEKYMDEESRITRGDIRDNRVHCCIYFISPHMHEMKPLDVEVIARLQDKTNVIPVIARADSLTDEECERVKEEVLHGIMLNKLQIYKFPEDDDDDDDDDEEEESGEISIKAAKQQVPFAVCASLEEVLTDAGAICGRQYPWGKVEVDNRQHCDFVYLRDLVVRTYMQHLIDVTHDVHYEKFRRQNLSGLALRRANSVASSRPSSTLIESDDVNPMKQFEDELEQHAKKIQKMEEEMSRVFEAKVAEKEAKLARQESELEAQKKRQQDELSALHARLTKEQAAFDEAKRQYREEQQQQEMARRSSVSEKDKKKKGFFHA